jgi:hypothetical protein
MNPPLKKLFVPEPVFMKLGMYVMTLKTISMAYFINPSHQSVCLYVPPSYGWKTTVRLFLSLYSVLGNGFVKTSPRPGIHATIEEMLDVLSK